MIEENLSNPLAIEDVSNPQGISFNPEPEAPSAEPPKGRSAIEKSLEAIEKVEGKIPENPRDEKLEKEAKAVKDEPKPAKERQPDGKFASKAAENPQNPQPDNVNAEPEDKPDDGQKPVDPPKPPPGERDVNRPPDNFLPRAKEKWAEAPEEVRSEFYRALDNFEKGKTEYQEDREFRKPLRQFEEMARASGLTVHDAVRNYVELDQLVTANPVEGVARILARQNIDIVGFAQHILHQAQTAQENPVQAQAQQVMTYAQQLEQQNQQLQAVLQEQQRLASIQQVEATLFTEFRKDHPRFDELREDIALFWNSGKVPSNLSEQQRLEVCYDMAERINPAPNSTNRSAQRSVNPAGEKSIRGSLTNGLDVTAPKGAKVNSRDAIKAAMDQLGL